jgi:hypothetical protein
MHNTSVTALSLSWNKLTPHGTPQLASLIAKNTTITSLYLGTHYSFCLRCHFCMLSIVNVNYFYFFIFIFIFYFFFVLVFLFVRIHSRFIFDLYFTVMLSSHAVGSNPIGDHKQSMKALTRAIAKNTTLRQLSLLGIMKGHTCESCLAKIPIKNSSLTDLNLSDNHFSANGMCEEMKKKKNSELE